MRRRKDPALPHWNLHGRKINSACLHANSGQCMQGRSQEFVFFIIRGANYINLYKNLMKFQIYNVKLGTIGGQAPAPPSYAPASRAAAQESM